MVQQAAIFLRFHVFFCLLVSALEDQASALGVPLGIFSARAAVANIEKLSAESGQTGLLNAEQRVRRNTVFLSSRDLERGVCCALLLPAEGRTVTSCTEGGRVHPSNFAFVQGFACGSPVSRD